MSVASAAAVRLRDLAQDDLEEVARIDALHTGREKPAYWSRVFDEFVARGGSVARVGLAAEIERVPGAGAPGRARTVATAGTGWAGRVVGADGVAAAGSGRAGARPLQAGIVGYLLGEVRAFEFGSEPCGWVFAVGVDPAHAREGIASLLLGEACARFRSAGVETVRTMVRRDDIPVLSFFRRRGFVGGSFYQLEMSLGVRT